jgi:hypothetical protein
VSVGNKPRERHRCFEDLPRPEGSVFTQIVATITSGIPVQNIISHYRFWVMGTGLSPLQRQILAVLPDEGNGEWARPKQILDTLGLEPTPSTRTIMSRALGRLHKRGLISVIVTDLALPGKSRLYARRDRPKYPPRVTRTREV